LVSIASWTFIRQTSNHRIDIRLVNAALTGHGYNMASQADTGKGKDPTVPAGTEPGGMADNDAAQRSLERLSVLIVDDNQNMRRLLQALLRAARITAIYEAGSGKEAFAVLANSRPDIIITDLAMQPLNGIEFVRKLRGDPDSPGHAIPVIMLTGYCEEAMVVKARAAGVNDFVAKPVSARILKERIERVVFDDRNAAAVR
jgi:CheY-like chemotaxis protein